MNATEDINRYCDLNNTLYSPTLSRRAAAVSSYDFPDQSPKKEKKWTFGSLFRRKKKNESESSSEDDTQKRGFLRKKRKPDKRKKKVVGTFDHVVMPASKGPIYTNTLRDGEVLSDPSSYSAYVDRLLPSIPTYNNGGYASHESFICDNNKSPQLPSTSSSTDNLNRKSRRELVKARIQAKRESMARDSSSDDDSHSSSRFRSDESLSKSHHHRDGSLSRRSRAARTERYLRRQSRDDENLNVNRKNGDLVNRSPSRSPLPKYKPPSDVGSGLSTIPPSHLNNKLKSSHSFNRPPAFDCARKYIDFNARMPGKALSFDGSINKEGRIPLKVNNSIDLQRQPPPPPPRDPKRLGIFFDSGRPTSYSFERAAKNAFGPGFKSNSFNNDSYIRPTTEINKTHSFNWASNGRSTSEDNLQMNNIRLPPRPSSATPETPEQHRVLRKTNDVDSYQYLTDKSPRSRKPIFAQPSDSHQKTISQKSIEFWKQKDQEELNKQEKSTPQIFTSQTHVRTKVFLPESTEKVMNANKLLAKPSPERGLSPADTKSSLEEDAVTRKSANLEEALDELEAIYNSLRLGDEDLLERAEQREKAVAAQRLIESTSEAFPGYRKGAVSDDGVDLGKRKKHSRRSRVADVEKDDMAFRKLNKERSLTISNPQAVVSKVSYLLASPVYNTYEGEVDVEDKENKGKEPDVTLDDVVYRSVKHANNSLKVVEPQPPFGIPLGPVSPGANSDYLHAVPETTPVKVVKRRKIPDLVKDDLAFRNLRKDGNKEPALPQLTGEDFVNNNTAKFDYNSLKKRRAVRSLSANISNIMSDIPRRTYSFNDDNGNDTPNTSALTDVADAMEIARQVLKEKENRINATRRGFLSDTDASVVNKDTPHTNSLRMKRLNFLNGLKHDNEISCDNENLHQKLRVHIPLLGDDFLQSKPPRCLTPDRKVRSPTKESTPIPVSPLERVERVPSPIRWSPSERRRGVKESTPIPVSPLEDTKSEYTTSSFDDLLRSIAKETKECSDRITEELNNLANPTAASKKTEEEEDKEVKLPEELLEKTEEDEVKDLNEQPEPTVANVVVTCNDQPPKQTDEAIESEHDYENMVSDRENEIPLPVLEKNRDSKSPFEEHKEELVAVFQKIADNEKTSSDTESDGAVEGELSVDVLDNRDCVVATKAIAASPSPPPENRLKCSDSLKSPRLVLETSRTACGRQSRDSNDCQKSWYYDPVLIAVACVYGVACAHQIASLDFTVFLALILAVLSVIVALVF